MCQNMNLPSGRQRLTDVISDVSTMKSEVGVLYLSDFNRKALLKLLHSANLEFHHLIDCQAYVYLWKNHPLANEKSISYSQLAKYPCLSFEQGDKSSFICQRRFCLPMNIPEQSRLRIGRLC